MRSPSLMNCSEAPGNWARSSRGEVLSTRTAMVAGKLPTRHPE